MAFDLVAFPNNSSRRYLFSQKTWPPQNAQPANQQANKTQVPNDPEDHLEELLIRDAETRNPSEPSQSQKEGGAAVRPRVEQSLRPLSSPSTQLNSAVRRGRPTRPAAAARRRPEGAHDSCNCISEARCAILRRRKADLTLPI